MFAFPGDRGRGAREKERRLVFGREHALSPLASSPRRLRRRQRDTPSTTLSCSNAQARLLAPIIHRPGNKQQHPITAPLSLQRRIVQCLCAGAVRKQSVFAPGSQSLLFSLTHSFNPGPCSHKGERYNGTLAPGRVFLSLTNKYAGARQHPSRQTVFPLLFRRGRAWKRVSLLIINHAQRHHAPVLASPNVDK